MEVKHYENWMKPQVVELFCKEYNVNAEYFNNLMSNFYEHPYQKDKCILVACLDKERVVGFQSFFYWPYKYNGKTLNSYQSGNSLVHPNYRGKGLFQKMLNFVENERVTLKIDFLMGFPVEMSYKSFIKNNWKNILNLSWYVKVVNPLAFLFSEKKLKAIFADTALILNENSNNAIHLENSADFLTWRNEYSTTNSYYCFNYSEGENNISFHLKFQKRKKIIHELTIGTIVSNTNNKQFIQNAFKQLMHKVKKCKAVSTLTIAINTAHSSEINTFINKEFSQISKKIYFIVKPFSNQDIVTNPANWMLYRGDIDTW